MKIKIFMYPFEDTRREAVETGVEDSVEIEVEDSVDTEVEDTAKTELEDLVGRVLPVALIITVLWLVNVGPVADTTPVDVSIALDAALALEAADMADTGTGTFGVGNTYSLVDGIVLSDPRGSVPTTITLPIFSSLSVLLSLNSRTLSKCSSSFFASPLQMNAMVLNIPASTHVAYVPEASRFGLTDGTMQSSSVKGTKRASVPFEQVGEDKMVYRWKPGFQGVEGLRW